jgi:hypothetical protein
LFIISADGYHQNSHIILPFDTQREGVTVNHLKFLHVQYSAKGWMTKIMFEEICTNFLLPAIKHARDELRPEERTRAILILDGASVHSNRRLMERFRFALCDVVCIPPHTSQLIQPLDCRVN